MTALPDVVLEPECSDQTPLPLASEGVQRYLWRSRWGDMLIEVQDGLAYVNGQVVEPANTTDSSL